LLESETLDAAELAALTPELRNVPR
jgi:hypothetical protein